MFRTVAYPAGPLHGLVRGAATYQIGACARGGNISLEIIIASRSNLAALKQQQTSMILASEVTRRPQQSLDCRDLTGWI
jgi:hypothetical protein